MSEPNPVPASRRGRTLAVGAALVVAAVVAVLVVVGVVGGSGGAPSCSSYPRPGQLAPAGTAVPAAIAARYSVLGTPARAVDRLPQTRLTSLGASGVIASGTRYLGNSAFGGRIYLVPAQHLLSFTLAPPRCLTAVERTIAQGSQAFVRSQYREAAVCLVVLYPTTRQQECAAAQGNPYALLLAPGTPGFGLVPDGVSAVTVTYETAPPRTIEVARNSFAVIAPSQRALPCGLQWLDPTGNVSKVVYGCSYLKWERPALAAYRTYAASKLSTLRSQVAALAAAVAAGNLAGARSAWLSAHRTWLEIGQDDGAYGAFGALGGQIDGLAAGHPQGTSDSGFTGFHRIEFDLFTKRDLDAAAADTAALQRLLAELTKTPLTSYLPSTPTSIGNWLLRPHEVLEDALRDSLTANDDYGSGTDLASVVADTAAVRELLHELQPVLDPIAPGLRQRAEAQLDALIGAIGPARANATGVSIQDLPARQRQQIDAELGATLETLAPLPDLITSSGANAPAD
jgi:iron uptake system EfeUOB component EfeO/EfeM